MTLLFDSALKATVILFAAWTATLALRRASAGVRHAIWLAAILTVAILPGALSIPQGAIPSAVRIVVPVLPAGPQMMTRKLPWLLLIWTAGAGIVLVRLITGIVSAIRITRSARLLDGILYSDRATAPMTWGLLRPVVILPAYAAAWTAAERDLVLRHERAHIARHDWLWQMLASMLTAVFWFHPLMWLANFRLRREAEGAVDDLVLAAGAAPSDYAGRLVDVARRMHGISTFSTVIPMVRKPELEMRVQSILDPSRRRESAGILVRCAVTLVAVAVMFPAIVTRQPAYAQDKPYRIGGGVSQPKVISKVEPVYPEDAKDEKIEGTVRLLIVITAAGVADDIKVSHSLDPRLDASAIAAVSKWTFQPGTKDGKPVPVFATIEVTFRWN